MVTALPKLLDDALNIHLRGHFSVPVRKFDAQEMVCEQGICVGKLGFQRELVRFIMELKALTVYEFTSCSRRR